MRCQLADGFDFPVGKPEAKGYHRTRGFSPNGHLGEDWNGDGGGDTDMGDPIYATARGVVVFSENVHAAWGNMIVIRHAFRESDGRITIVDSLYGHMLERLVKVGDTVERGQHIAKLGGNNGMYSAHLHFEMHKNLAMGPNRGKFARDYSNYYSPIAFISAHRTCPADYKKYDIPVDTFGGYNQEPTEAQLQRSRGVIVPIGKATPLPVTKPEIAKAAPKNAPTTTGKTDANAKPAEPEAKGDFWTRLRAKLGNGTATNGVDNRK